MKAGDENSHFKHQISPQSLRMLIDLAVTPTNHTYAHSEGTTSSQVVGTCVSNRCACSLCAIREVGGSVGVAADPKLPVKIGCPPGPGDQGYPVTRIELLCV